MSVSICPYSHDEVIEGGPVAEELSTGSKALPRRRYAQSPPSLAGADRLEGVGVPGGERACQPGRGRPDFDATAALRVGARGTRATRPLVPLRFLIDPRPELAMDAPTDRPSTRT